MAAKAPKEGAALPAPQPPTSLYALTDEALKLDQEIAVLGGEVSEGTEGAAIAEKLEWVRALIVKKVDNVVRYVRSLTAHRDAVAAEIEFLQTIKGYDDNKLKSLKQLCLDVMEKQGPDVKELKGEIFKIAKQRNGGKTPIEWLVDDPTKMPEAFTKWVPAVDEEAVRRALEADALAEVAAKEAGQEFKPSEVAKIARFGAVGHHIRFK